MSPLDAALVAVSGPRGSALLDDLVESGPHDRESAQEAWRTWVDEVLASWASCLLASPELALARLGAQGVEEHGVSSGYNRLIHPGTRDRRAAALLRHPDLHEPIAGLHRAELLDRMTSPKSEAS